MDLIVYGWDLLKDFKQVVSMLIPVDFLIHIIVVLMVEDLYRIEVVHVLLFIGGIRVQMDGRIVVQRPIQIDVVLPDRCGGAAVFLEYGRGRGYPYQSQLF